MISPIRKCMACIGLAVVLEACGTLSVNEEKQLGHQVQRQVRQQVQLLRDLIVVSYVRLADQPLMRNVLADLHTIANGPGLHHLGIYVERWRREVDRLSNSA